MSNERAERDEANKIAGIRSTLQELEEKYRHLPPLRPQLPGPLYLVQGAPVYRADVASTAFYEASSNGNLDHVRAYVETSQPSGAELAYALEEACQSFQLDIVRLLMQQPDTQLHYRCFRRCLPCPEDDPTKKWLGICKECPEDDLATKFGAGLSHAVSQSIFTSGDSRLLDLLKVLLEFGWHPNQLIGPPQKGKTYPLCLPRQEVALHYPRCILDLDILRFLLDNDADPTIGRELHVEYWFVSRPVVEQPVTRLSGDILQLAVNLGAIETVTLLLSRGVRPEHGIPLHSLVRRRPDSSQIKTMDDAYARELWLEHPELQNPYLSKRYPTLSTRFVMARHLLSHGEDIDRVADVYSIVGPYCQVPTRSHLATALSHAKDSMDWPFVQWLLENGAEPTAFPDTNFPSEMIYGIGTSQGGVEDIFRGMVKEVEKDKGIRITMVKRESPGC